MKRIPHIKEETLSWAKALFICDRETERKSSAITICCASMMRCLLLLPCLLAASFLQAAPPVTTLVYNAGDDWLPVKWNPGTIVPGSALDFSSRLEAPAGKNGPVICKDGRFVFSGSPDKPVRFYGTVISHSLPYLEKDQCERMADYLAASGYSAVRLHCYGFAKGTMKDTGSPEFTPEARDKLDYFFHSLRKRGIYYTLQINNWSFFKAGDAADVPEFRDVPFRFESSGLLPISEKLQTWFKDYATNLFTHVNPYSGVALKDDPAMISVELENESSILAGLGQHPALVKPYQRLCREHLVKTLGHDPSPAEVDHALPLFALEKQQAFNTTTVAFLRSIGVRQPLTNLNFRDNQVYALPRSQLDYVDIHDYWALYRTLPLAAGEKPSADAPYSQTWLNPANSGWATYLGPVSGRLFGKPYLCTEFNGCYPSPYYSFVGPVEAVLASTQEWSGVFRCGPAADGARFFSEKPVRQIGFSHDPQIMFSERIGALLYGDGEVKPLPDRLPFVVTPEYLRAHLDIKGGPRYPEVYSKLAFDYQTGTVLLDGTEKLDDFACLVAPSDMELPASLANKKVLRADAQLPEQLKAAFPSHRGSAGLHVDENAGSCQVVTPCTETFLLSAATASASGANVSIAGSSSTATCFAGSLDRKPLEKSHHILILYLTDLKNSGTEIEDPHGKDGRVVVRKPGGLPLLLRRGKIGVALKHATGGTPKVWALKYDGSRAVEVGCRGTADGVAFDAQAVTSSEVFGVFEVVWDG